MYEPEPAGCSDNDPSRLIEIPLTDEMPLMRYVAEPPVQPEVVSLNSSFQSTTGTPPTSPLPRATPVIPEPGGTGSDSASATSTTVSTDARTTALSSASSNVEPLGGSTTTEYVPVGKPENENAPPASVGATWHSASQTCTSAPATAAPPPLSVTSPEIEPTGPVTADVVVPAEAPPGTVTIWLPVA